MAGRRSAQRHGPRDRGRAGLRHRPSRHDAGLPAGARRYPEAPPAATHSRSRYRHRRARHGGRQGAAAAGRAATSTRSRSRPRAPMPRPTAWRPSCARCWRRSAATPNFAAGAPYDLIFANILARPLRLWPASIGAVGDRGGRSGAVGLQPGDVPGILSSYAAQGFALRRRIDLEGWATLMLSNGRGRVAGVLWWCLRRAARGILRRRRLRPGRTSRRDHATGEPTNGRSCFREHGGPNGRRSRC